jgi:hypothetical protein
MRVIKLRSFRFLYISFIVHTNTAHKHDTNIARRHLEPAILLQYLVVAPRWMLRSRLHEFELPSYFYADLNRFFFRFYCSSCILKCCIYTVQNIDIHYIQIELDFSQGRRVMNDGVLVVRSVIAALPWGHGGDGARGAKSAPIPNTAKNFKCIWLALSKIHKKSCCLITLEKILSKNLLVAGTTESINHFSFDGFCYCIVVVVVVVLFKIFCN